MPRKDNRGYVLHSGEYQRADGRYCFAYTDRTGKRHQIYSKTLVGMRERRKNSCATMRMDSTLIRQARSK